MGLCGWWSGFTNAVFDVGHQAVGTVEAAADFIGWENFANKANASGGSLVGTAVLILADSSTKAGTGIIIPTSMFGSDTPDIYVDVNFVGQSTFHYEGPALGFSINYGASVSGIPTPSMGVSFELSQLKGSLSDQLNMSHDVNVQVGSGLSLVFDEDNGVGGVSIKPGFALDVSAGVSKGGYMMYLNTKSPYLHFEKAKD